MVTSDDPGQPEQEDPRERPEHDRRHGTPEAEPGNEQRAGEEHQETDPEVCPEHEVVQEAEHAMALRDRLDPELGSCQVTMRGRGDVGLGRHQKAT